MIIVTKGDYSENNIGQVILEKEVTEEVQAIADAYGITSLDTIYKIQDFYNEMVLQGLWSRMEKLYIPLLAPTLNKTFVNLKTSNNDWEPNAALYNKTDHGIIAIEDGASDLSNIPFVRSIANSSMFVFCTSTAAALPNGSGQDATHIMFFNGLNTFRSNLASNSTYSHAGRFGSTGTTFLLSDFSKTSQRGLFMTAGGAVGEAIKGYGCGRETTLATAAVVPTGSFATINPLRNHSNNIRLRVPCAAWGYGDYFSFEDYKKLETALFNLEASLLE